MFYTEVKVMNIIAFTIVTFIQIMHYKKTKIKYIGMRILITLITTIICWVIIYNGYGIFYSTLGLQYKGYFIESLSIRILFIIYKILLVFNNIYLFIMRNKMTLLYILILILSIVINE